MNSEALGLCTDARLLIDSERFHMVFQPQRSEITSHSSEGHSENDRNGLRELLMPLQALVTWSARCTHSPHVEYSSSEYEQS